MVKSKAVDLIKSLQSSELKEFGDFVRSPYFNKNSKLVDLFELIKGHYPDFSKKTFTKENFYRELFPGRKYNDGTIRKLLSALQFLGESYLAQSNLMKQNGFQRSLALLAELNTRKLDRLFKIRIEEQNRIYKILKNLEDDYFKSNFELEVMNINFRLDKGRAGFDSERAIDSLLRCATYLICYSLITLFKLNQDVMVTEVGSAFDYKDTIVYKFIESLGPDKFIDLFRKYVPEFYPVMEIYFCRFMIASGKDEDRLYYSKMKESIFENLELFTRFEKYNMMLFLENSCTSKMQDGADMKEELFSIHQTMLSKSLYKSTEKAYFPLLRFRHILINAISLNELEWAENFVVRYIDELPERNKKNMQNFSQAVLNFSRKDYNSSLEHISRVKFEIFSVKFDSWLLKLKAEFELNLYEQALYSIDSFRHSVRNDTDSPERMKKRFVMFLNYLHKLLILRDNGKSIDRFELVMISKEISVCDSVFEKKWLLEKYDELTRMNLIRRL